MGIVAKSNAATALKFIVASLSDPEECRTAFRTSMAAGDYRAPHFVAGVCSESARGGFGSADRRPQFDPGCFSEQIYIQARKRAKMPARMRCQPWGKNFSVSRTQ